MVPSGSIRPRGRGTPLRLVCLAAATLLAQVSAVAAYGAGQETNTRTTTDPQVRSQTTDRYVGGKYDKTGVYIPPHYQPVTKPRSHGYFFNKHEAGDQATKPN